MKLLREILSFTAGSDSYFEKVSPIAPCAIRRVAVYAEDVANNFFKVSVFKEKTKGVWVAQETVYANGRTAVWEGYLLIEGGEIFNVVVEGDGIITTGKFYCEVYYEPLIINEEPYPPPPPPIVTPAKGCFSIPFLPFG